MLKIRQTDPLPSHHAVLSSIRGGDPNPQTPLSYNDQNASSSTRHGIQSGTPRNFEQLASMPRAHPDYKNRPMERIAHCSSDYSKDPSALVAKKYIAHMKKRNHVVVKMESDTMGGINTTKTRSNLVILCSPRTGPKTDPKNPYCRSESQESAMALNKNDPLSPTHIPIPRSNASRLSKAIESHYSKDIPREEYYKLGPNSGGTAATTTNAGTSKIPRPWKMPEGINETNNITSGSSGCYKKQALKTKKTVLALPDDSNYNSIVTFMAGVKKIMETGKSRMHLERQSTAEAAQKAQGGEISSSTSNNLLFIKTSALTKSVHEGLAASHAGVTQSSTNIGMENSANKDKSMVMGPNKRRTLIPNCKYVELKRPPDQPANLNTSKFRAGRKFRPLNNGGTATSEQIAGLISPRQIEPVLKEYVDSPKPHHRCVFSMDNPTAPQNLEQVAGAEESAPEIINLEKTKAFLHIQDNERLNLFPMLKVGSRFLSISFAVPDIIFPVPLSIAQ